MISIRAAGAADWRRVARICADTGLQGDPVDPAEADEFAERWIAPYRVLRPDWTFVALEGDLIVGYLTGSPDTLAFEEERMRVFKPGPDSREYFPMDFRLELWSAHPAHLHMNVAAASRGRGAGTRLLAAFLDALRGKGVASAHVFCGERASGYWGKAGFKDVSVIEPYPSVRLHAMARPV